MLSAGGISIDTIRTRDGDEGPHVGGNAVYAAAGAWLVGADAGLCARVGSDFPAELMRELERVRFDTSRVRSTAGRSLKVTLDYRSDPRRQSYAADSGHNEELDPTPDQLGRLDRRWALHICGISPGRQRELIDAASGLAALLTLDTVVIPGEIEPDADGLLLMAARCDAFLPSREEVAHLWRGQPPREVLRMLVDAGCRAAVIKLGAGGSIGITDQTITWMPAYPATATDTTGAGDAYCGAFAATFAEDGDLKQAMAWATAAASMVIEVFGALSPLTDYARHTVAQRAHMLLSESGKGG
jgi:ribokinase